MTEQGPFRETDPVLSRLDRLLERQEIHGVALDELTTDVRALGRRPPAEPSGPSVGVWMARIFMATFCGSILLIGGAFGIRACDAGCDAHTRQQTAEDRAEHDQYCGALGLRYAGIAQLHDHEVGWYSAVVCGNGHGDGMYVGRDGLLHGLKTHRADPAQSAP